MDCSVYESVKSYDFGKNRFLPLSENELDKYAKFIGHSSSSSIASAVGDSSEKKASVQCSRVVSAIRSHSSELDPLSRMQPPIDSARL